MIEREQLSQFRVRFTNGERIAIAERVTHEGEEPASFLVRIAYYQKKASHGPLKILSKTHRTPRWKNLGWFPSMGEAELEAAKSIT